MAKYGTTLRNNRMTQVMNAVRGGTLLLCTGTVPTTLATPSAGNILSQHAVDAAAGSVSSGVLTFTDADLGQDSSADNSGTPTYAVWLDSGATAVAQYSIPSQMTISINGGATTAITAGNPTDIDSCTITEGNP